jgi:hypothetical protein
VHFSTALEFCVVITPERISGLRVADCEALAVAHLGSAGSNYLRRWRFATLSCRS